MLITTLLVASAAALFVCGLYRFLSGCAGPVVQLDPSTVAVQVPRTAPVVTARAPRPAEWPTQPRDEASAADVETELRCHGLSASDVALVSSRARELGMKPLTMWTAIRAYGAREVAVAVAGDLSHEAMLEHLAAGTTPDFGELEVFAALNGLEAAADVSGQVSAGSAGRAPAMDRSRMIERDPFAGLAIFEPGSWPGGAQAA